MQNYTLLIAGNNSKTISNIKPKLGLVREFDKVVDTNIKGVSGVLKNCSPDAILFIVDGADKQILDVFKKIKQDKRFKLTPVIFFIEKNYDEEFMSEAFSIGLDDFIYCPINDTEISLRIKANLKKKTAFQNIDNQKVFLKEFDVIDEDGVYKNKFAQKVFDIQVANTKEFNHSFVMMLFSYSDAEKLIVELKKQMRLSDVLGHLSKNIYYLIMPKTSLNHSRNFYRKVKENLDEGFDASACEYNSKMDFKYLTMITLKGLKEASFMGDEIVTISFSDVETFAGSVTQKRVKNYKIFQKAFDKKVENIILPTFQNIKTHLDEKYPYNVKIDFFSTASKSYFSVQHIPSEVEVALKINYLGHSKIMLETIYTHKMYQTINAIEFDLNEISDKIISKGVTNIINEFDRLVE